MSSLLDMFGQLATPEVIQEAGKLLGENPAATKTALDAIAPTLLSSVASKGSTPDGAQQILNMLNDPKVQSGLSSVLSGKADASALVGAGAAVLPSLLGGNTSGVTSAISSLSGLAPASVGKLMAIAAPVVAGLLSKTVSSQGLNANGLSQLLAGQKAELSAAVPASVQNALMATPEPAPVKAAPPKPASPPPPPPAPPKRSIWSWLLPLLGVVILGGLLLALCNQQQTPDPRAVACQNIAGWTNNLNAIPAVTADTKVTDLRASLTTARGSLDTIANAARSLNIAQVNEVVAAYDSLDGVLNAITGETVGADNVAAVTQGVDSFKQVGGGLKSALNCP